MGSLRILGAITSVVALIAFCGDLRAGAPIWEADFGEELNLADDDTATFSFGDLDFAFPFGGTIFSGDDLLSISSNGFVSVGGSNGHGCCGGSPQGLLASAFGRIAVLWTDLNPTISGDVYLRTIDDGGGPANERLVVTWDTIFFGTGGTARVQMQLAGDGSMVLSYDVLDPTGSFNDVLVGVSPAGGVADPGPIDFSMDSPYSSEDEPTIYELFPGSPPIIDLSDTSITFAPNGSGGYDVEHVVCSQPPIWESNLGVDLALGNDDVALLFFSDYGFTFPFAGQEFGGADILAVSSNGFLSLGGDNGAGCCAGNPQELVDSAFGRIAPFWTDLDPSASGKVHLNAFDDIGGQGTDRLVVTWAGVRTISGDEVSLQAQLFKNGRIILGFQCFSFAAPLDDVLVGIGPGGGVGDPGSVDFTATIPFNSGPESTVYELFEAGSFPVSDLGESVLSFTPNGIGGYSVSNVVGPTNDNCINAQPLEEGTFEGTTAHATNDGIAECGSSSSNPDVWYVYQSMLEGVLNVSTCGTHDFPSVDRGIDTVLSAHDGCGGVELACNDDWPSVGLCIGDDIGIPADSALSLPVSPGDEIYIRVSTFGIAGSVPGRFQLNVEFIQADPFIRGDVDGDGEFFGIVDSIYLFNFQFAGGPPPPCLEAADADGNGELVGLVDGIFVLSHQFQGGPPPAPPYPGCGIDPDPASSLGCDTHACP